MVLDEATSNCGDPGSPEHRRRMAHHEAGHLVAFRALFPEAVITAAELFDWGSEESIATEAHGEVQAAAHWNTGLGKVPAAVENERLDPPPVGPEHHAVFGAMLVYLTGAAAEVRYASAGGWAEAGAVDEAVGALKEMFATEDTAEEVGVREDHEYARARGALIGLDPAAGARHAVGLVSDERTWAAIQRVARALIAKASLEETRAEADDVVGTFAPALRDWYEEAREAS